MALQRSRLRKGWGSAILFLALVTLPVTWVLLKPATRLQEIVGTIVASVIVGLVEAGFLYYEGVQAKDVGLGRRHWVEGLALFAAWWVAVTVVDLGGGAIAGLLGRPMAAMGPLQK